MADQETITPVPPGFDTAKFWANLGPPEGPKACRLWQRARSKAGYGQVRVAGVAIYAHRIAYVLAVGSIPPGQHVCHRCDTPACCEPTHLFAGTPSDNLSDAAKKGRLARGARNIQTKLTEANVATMRAEWANGVPVLVLARKYGVSTGTVYPAIARRTWKYVT